MALSTLFGKNGWSAGPKALLDSWLLPRSLMDQ